VYKLRIELNDGKIYESSPDTLLAPGTIDSLYQEFTTTHDFSTFTRHWFDVKVNTHGNQHNSTHYKWDMKGTFKAITRPGGGQCYPIPEEGIICNFILPCTGLRIKKVNGKGDFDPATGLWRIGPCTCCTCWYDFFNQVPLLSDDQFNVASNLRAVPIYSVPLSPWYFMFKTRIEVTMATLTENSYSYFKSIADQKNAVGSLFQPVTGQIHTAFIQISGDLTPLNGIFYTAGVSYKSMYISADDVPAAVTVPKIDYNDPIYAGIGVASCLEFFPNATNIKPDFWED
jgi:hypothetical protein